MKPKRYLIVYLWIGVYDLAIWLFLLLMYSFWGTKLQWIEGVWFEWKERSWPVRTWFKKWGGTCLGHGGWFSPGKIGRPGVIDTETEYHEHVHTEQFEAAMLMGFLIAISVTLDSFLRLGIPPNWYLVFCIWNLSSPLLVVCSMFVAWVRGENAYRGSTLEEAAYALAEKYERSKRGPKC